VAPAALYRNVQIGNVSEHGCWTYQSRNNCAARRIDAGLLSTLRLSVEATDPSAPRVLLVEDDATIREMTQLSLERDGFAVSTAADGTSGLARFRSDPVDVVLLDVMLPGIDGVSVCRAIRERSVVPIVMLTARTDPVDVVLGLEAGADDYVTKPFEPPILAARLRALLRRVARHDASPVLQLGTLRIDRDGMVVHVGDDLVSLTPTEYRLLLELAEHCGAVRSRERLLEDVWGYVWAGDTRLVDMHVRRLRLKIGAEMIETVRGSGYKLVRRDEP
jgi:DNA-binding response OmpR family regulator